MTFHFDNDDIFKSVFDRMNDEEFRKEYLNDWGDNPALANKIRKMESNIENKRNAIPTQAPQCDKTQHGI